MASRQVGVAFPFKTGMVSSIRESYERITPFFYWVVSLLGLSQDPRQSRNPPATFS